MILDRIRRLYPELTRSQKLLADFVVASYLDAAFMTACRLADRLDLNEATVVRFAQRLGYTGYPEFVEDIQNVVREELGVKADALEQLAEENVFFDLFGQELDTVQRAISHVPPGQVALLLRKLEQAARVVIVGQGISACLAELMSLSLQSIGKTAVHYPSDPPGLSLMLGHVDAETVVVAIAVGSSSPQLARALGQAKQRGAWTLALGCSAVSACAQAADMAIHSPVSDPFPLPSVTMAATVIDALVQTLASGEWDVVQRRQEDMRQTESLIERAG